jgi:hypothetical protein
MNERKEQLLGTKWVDINERADYRRIFNCINLVQLRAVGKYLYKIRCK